MIQKKVLNVIIGRQIQKNLIFLGRLQCPQLLRHKGGCLEQSSEAAGRKLVSTDNDMPINPVK